MWPHITHGEGEVPLWCLDMVVQGWFCGGRMAGVRSGVGVFGFRFGRGGCACGGGARHGGDEVRWPQGAEVVGGYDGCAWR
ncbi:hypothetical protein GYH30_005881 [Glycine max]|nr:hypothetical protein GYH30_005881 [Glycine max]